MFGRIQHFTTRFSVNIPVMDNNTWWGSAMTMVVENHHGIDMYYSEQAALEVDILADGH